MYTFKKSKQNKSNQIRHQTIMRGVKKQSKNKQKIQYDKIQRLDPAFSAPQITARVEQAFYIIKHAWSEHDMSAARGFITDGIYQRYAIQFDIQKQHQRHRKLVDLSIQHCELVGVEADKIFETLHFEVSSRSRQTSTNTATSAKSKKLPPFTNTIEYLTYIRLPGVKTRLQPGLMEGICPNCGSPLLLNKFEQCQACNSLVTSGEYDWILAKITQAEEWRFQNAKRQVKGVADYQVVDANFNLPAVEDRVSVIFWLLQKAWLLQKSDALLSVAHADYIDYFINNELNDYYFDHIELALCEVSSVEFGDEFDQVFVLVKWQAAKVSRMKSTSQSTCYYAHHLTLIRKAGVISNTKKGLHSLHCFSCGAPQNESYHDSCQYCHTRFNQGDSDWILKDFSPHIDRVVKLKGKSFSIEPNQSKIKGKIFDPISLFSGLVLILLADGKVHPKEQALLVDFAKKRRIPQSVVDGIFLAGQQGELTMLAPDEVLDASAWLVEMIKMCLMDGEVSQSERELLLSFGKKFNILAIDIDLRIKEIRAQLTLASRDRAGTLK